MRILFLTRLFYPHVGGVEKHIKEVSGLLLRENYHVTVVTTKFKRNLPSFEKHERISIIRFPQPKVKLIGLLYTWFWLFKHIFLIKQSDIVHCHDIFIWYLPFKFVLPRKRVFTTYHGRWGQHPIPAKDLVQKKLGARLSSGVICIGDYINKNYGVRGNFVTYGAVKIPLEFRKKSDNLILYVGRLDKDLALPILFSVLERLRAFEIHFCGDGNLRSEAEIYGTVHGFSDPSPFYSKANYCFASGYLTILEAMANKCLVFTAYSNPLQKDYYRLTPFSKYIICSDKPEVLLRKFHYYKSNPKAAQKLVDEAYEWVKGQTWEKLTNQYLELWGVKS